MFADEVSSRDAVGLLQERQQEGDESLRVDPVVAYDRDLVLFSYEDS